MTRMFQAETHREQCLGMLSARSSPDIADPILVEYRDGGSTGANTEGGGDKLGPGTLQGSITTAEYSLIEIPSL